MADIVELLLADHALIRRLLAGVETALGQPDDADSGTELPGRWQTLAALLEMHAEAAEEIGFPALFGRTATVARDNARATHGDLREAVGEARLCQLVFAPGGWPSSRPALRLSSTSMTWNPARWPDSSAMHDAGPGNLGRQRVAFVVASTACDTRHDPLGNLA